MQALPWRILVVTDVGVDAVRPVRIEHEGLDDWIASLEASPEVALPGGARRIPFRDREAFTPARVTASLGDAASPPTVDAVLHHPAVQRLESAWRGLELLLEHAGDAVAVEVISLPRSALTARFRESVAIPESERADPLSLVVIDLDFANGPDDLSVLRSIADLAAGFQAPVVAGASPAFFGLRYLVQVMSLPDLTSRLLGGPRAPWTTFQSSDEARWLALTLNRYLQREPYTPAAGGHSEAVSESNPDTYLWGRGAWLVAAAVARSVATHGHALDLSGPQGGGFAGMPVRSYPAKANESVALATEVGLSESHVLELYRAAFTPLASPLRSTNVFLPMVVTTFRLSPGRLTLEATLAYQLTAARLSQFCGRLLGALPAGSATEVASHIRTSLLDFLGPLAGDDEDVVTVELRERGDNAGPEAAVQVRPRATLEGKTMDFSFILPLQAV
jgi:EvpB/VC_A0108, tail sheath N-terminal domain